MAKKGEKKKNEVPKAEEPKRKTIKLDANKDKKRMVKDKSPKKMNTDMKSKNSPKKKNKARKRQFRVNKKLDGNIGTIFIGSEDPFLYFPDMMSYLEREEVKEVKLKARGRSISNAVNVSEQFKSRFKEIDTKVKDVRIGTEDVPRKDKKGTFRMSFIEITLNSEKKKSTE